MKSVLRYLLPGLIVVLMFAGCAKQPAQEINAAKSSVDAAVAEGAEKYAPEDAKRLNESLNIAMGEVKSQEGKLFKNYTQAKEMLAKVKADADAVKAGLAPKREDAKKQATAAQEAARSAVDGAKSLLSKAPKGKGGRADIEALKADLQGLEEALTDVQKSIDAEDYPSAMNRANAIKDKATAISGQGKQIIGKTSAKAGKKAGAKKVKQ